MTSFQILRYSVGLYRLAAKSALSSIIESTYLLLLRAKSHCLVGLHKVMSVKQSDYIRRQITCEFNKTRAMTYGIIANTLICITKNMCLMIEKQTVEHVGPVNTDSTMLLLLKQERKA
jgi:hypothetical protein